MATISSNLSNWDAEAFFRTLTATNKLAKENKFSFELVSGLSGFEELLAHFVNGTAFVCLKNEDDGNMQINNAPHTRRVKTVFMAMRHAVDRMDYRKECFEIMREIFRQFMSVLILQKTKLEQNHIYLDTRINFSEMNQYFADGCACAYFQVAVDVQTDLRYNADEWSKEEEEE